VNCYRETAGTELEEIGYILFAIFSFFLCAIIQGFGFGLSKNIFIGSAFFTALVVYVTPEVGGGEFVLTGLFCIVHPLSSFVGLFTDEPTFSKTVGWWFVVATIVGIVELSTKHFVFDGPYVQNLCTNHNHITHLLLQKTPVIKNKFHISFHKKRFKTHPQFQLKLSFTSCKT
jgi:hypothetical protein